MKKLLPILVLSLLWIIPVSADERFIPLELFTGGEMREDTEIKFTSANLVFGKKKRKTLQKRCGSRCSPSALSSWLRRSVGWLTTD